MAPPVVPDAGRPAEPKEPQAKEVAEATTPQSADPNAETLKRRLVRLALDVHDGPMQNLAVIGFSLGDLRRRIQILVPEEHQTKIDSGMDQISEELIRVESELRALIGALEHNGRDSIPVIDAIEQEIRDFEKRSVATVALTYDGDIRTETDSQRIALQSVTRAALANVAKHAAATNGDDRAPRRRRVDHARDRGRRPRLQGKRPSEARTLRSRRDARARRVARRRVRGREQAGRPDADHGASSDLAPADRCVSLVAPARVSGMSAGRIWLVAGPVAALLAVATFVHLGHGWNAFAWALVQVVLVALAAKDVEERRLPNVIILPVAAAAIVLRVGFERSDLVEVVVAGVVTFVVFYVLAMLLRGGLGMGDVKLAAMLGFLLGSAVFPALVIGIAAGGLWAVGLVVARKATMRSSIAYGPFLALGGAIAILAFNPPPLV